MSALSTICPGTVHANIGATTRFSGVSVEEEKRKQERYDNLYRKRSYGPEKMAKQIVRARREGPQGRSGHQARLRYLTNRVAPGIVRFVTARAELT